MAHLVTANVESLVTWDLTKQEARKAKALWSKCLKINELQVDHNLAKRILSGNSKQ